MATERLNEFFLLFSILQHRTARSRRLSPQGLSPAAFMWTTRELARLFGELPLHARPCDPRLCRSIKTAPCTGSVEPSLTTGGSRQPPSLGETLHVAIPVSGSTTGSNRVATADDQADVPVNWNHTVVTLATGWPINKSSSSDCARAACLDLGPIPLNKNGSVSGIWATVLHMQCSAVGVGSPLGAD